MAKLDNPQRWRSMDICLIEKERHERRKREGDPMGEAMHTPHSPGVGRNAATELSLRSK
jgi:hypothetical protein